MTSDYSFLIHPSEDSLLKPNNLYFEKFYIPGLLIDEFILILNVVFLYFYEHCINIQYDSTVSKNGKRD